MICDRCLHANVCGEEGAFEPALTYCVDYIGWIPVSEGLPEDSDEVLVTDGSDVFIAWHVVKAEIAVNEWRSHSELFSPYAYPIVAWMPLPEPYKAESENE